MEYIVELIFTIFLSQVYGYCPDGFVTHHGVCYKEFDIRATWEEATIYCEAYGGQLASVLDSSEQQFIEGLLQRLQQSSFHSDNIWLGATDQGHEGVWVWKSTGKSVHYTNWKTSEPNNAGSGENCLSISFRDNMLWNDMVCDNKYSFLCEVREDGVVSISG